MSENSGSGNPFYIFTYTRAQAIEDGELIDVSCRAKEAGFKHPAAISRAVHTEVIVPPDAARAVGETETGRLWDVLWNLRVAIAQPRNAILDAIHFQVIATAETGRRTLRQLWCQCGPGDTAAPVLTIMMEGED